MSSQITMTAAAAERIKEILVSQPDKKALRIAVSGGGCSGFQYEFDLEDKINPDDHKVERDGSLIVIDPVSLVYLLGSEITFADELIGASFQVNNPNATASCGCGTSFSI
ncbi:MAG TPA: iron-sulfur cluster insertion protein ErpA [Rhizobiales bacterium]|nr:iron-sulfur cluster insertion protein ErpA [Hyphomicrobiales bacterium]